MNPEQALLEQVKIMAEKLGRKRDTSVLSCTESTSLTWTEFAISVIDVAVLDINFIISRKSQAL